VWVRGCTCSEVIYGPRLCDKLIYGPRLCDKLICGPRLCDKLIYGPRLYMVRGYMWARVYMWAILYVRSLRDAAAVRRGGGRAGSSGDKEVGYRRHPSRGTQWRRVRTADVAEGCSMAERRVRIMMGEKRRGAGGKGDLLCDSLSPSLPLPLSD
jgi:hypothetical protein